MATKFETCDIPGLLVITPDVYADARGWFTEAYHAQRYFENGVKAVSGFFCGAGSGSGLK